MPQLTKKLKYMKDSPESLTLESPEMTILQSFIISSFSKNCDAVNVNEARQKMFTTGLKSLESSTNQECAVSTPKTCITSRCIHVEALLGEKSKHTGPIKLGMGMEPKD